MESQYWNATMIGQGMPVAKRRSEFDVQSGCLELFASRSWGRTLHVDCDCAEAADRILCEVLPEILWPKGFHRAGP